MSEPTLSWFQETYPIYSAEIAKHDQGPNIEDLITRLQQSLQEYERVQYIATFDHYTHTHRQSDGEIAEDIKDARNLIFCVGRRLPSPLAPALRPRSIGVVETEDRFVISYMQAPMQLANEIMKDCVEQLSKSFETMS